MDTCGDVCSRSGAQVGVCIAKYMHAFLLYAWMYTCRRSCAQMGGCRRMRYQTAALFLWSFAAKCFGIHASLVLA